jgi:hypothetical protein
LAIAVAAGVVAAVGGSLQAGAVIYEGFDYAVGSLKNNNGGTGFAGAWAATRNDPKVAAGSKTWGDLFTSGNHVVGNAWSGMIRPIGSTLSGAGLMANGATLWFSVVFDLEGQNFTNADLNLALGTDQFVNDVFDDRENLVAGEGIGVTHSKGTIQGVYWQNSDADAVAERVEHNSSTILTTTDFRGLIVGRIDWGANDLASETLTLYTPGPNLAINTPAMAAWTIPALDQSRFDTLALQFKDTSMMDEIRFGATYEDVIGNPPPPPVLTLRVDPVTGATSLLGDKYRAVAINYYQITSAAHSLDAVDWSSLADQDFEGGGPSNGTGNGWEEAGGAGSGALAEAFLLGNSTIAASQSVSLGKGYNALVGAKDLVFKYRTDSAVVLNGLVEYVTSALPGDANLDGVVDAADFIALKKSFGKSSGATYGDGDFDGDRGVDRADLAILMASFGQAGSAAMAPEPASMLLLAAGAAGLSARVGKGNSRGL